MEPSPPPKVYARKSFARSGLEQFADLTLEVGHGKRVYFDIGNTTEYTVRIMESTVYGTFQINQSGNGSYRAMRDFLGDDHILLEISDAAGNKKAITIRINVTKE